MAEQEYMICDCVLSGNGKGIPVLPPKTNPPEWREVICKCGNWIVSPNGRRMRKKNG